MAASKMLMVLAAALPMATLGQVTRDCMVRSRTRFIRVRHPSRLPVHSYPGDMRMFSVRGWKKKERNAQDFSTGLLRFARRNPAVNNPIR